VKKISQLAAKSNVVVALNSINQQFTFTQQMFDDISINTNTQFSQSFLNGYTNIF
jgi:hypothetical protein